MRYKYVVDVIVEHIYLIIHSIFIRDGWINYYILYNK